jgi:hypothetical protein
MTETPEGKLSARQRRALEHSAIHGTVIAESSKAAVIGGIVALGASFAAQRFSPLYRKISFPFKTFIVMSAITGTFFTVAGRVLLICRPAFCSRFLTFRRSRGHDRRSKVCSVLLSNERR